MPACVPTEHTERDIKFLEIRHLNGPNIWTYYPVLEAIVDIAKAANAISAKHGARKAPARGVRAIKKRSLLRIKFTGEI